MKLTPAEKDALDHHLEMMDDIAEVLYNDFCESNAKEDDLDLYQVYQDTVYEICNHLLKSEYKEAMEINEGLTKDVLIEAVEGSTYWAVHYSALGFEVTPQKLAAVVRVGESLARKIQAFCDFDRDIKFPNF